MAETKNEIREKLKLLRQSYLTQLPDQLDEIDACYEKLIKDSENKKITSNLHRLAHSIKGSSASFGFSEVSDAAKSLVQLLEPFKEKDTHIEAGILSEVRILKDLLHDAVDSMNQKRRKKVVVSSSSASGDTAKTGESRMVFIAERNHLLLEEMSIVMRQFGYEVAGFTRCEDFANALRNERHSAMIIDFELLQENLTCFAEVIDMRKEMDEEVPAIFISDCNDVNTRLQAVRVGSDAYFVKPVDIIDIAEKLDSLITGMVTEPYKILVVDDEPELAHFHSLILQEAGMDTEIVNSPLRVFDRLSEFGPDLILMDMYMPECDGMELAKTIRQMKAHFSIPIVFLSGETNVDKQMSAMIMGGDEFLTKPVKPEHLISAVTIRADRMRTIRSFMDRDSLTGLLNHTRTKLSLNIAVARAQRLATQVSFAMIDIDKFKMVNDTYGHPMGDKVIAGLARLLHQRFRKTDIIGRYGGEEFAVVLTDTDVQFAYEMLDIIRTSFSQIKFRHEDREFSVTFSAGVAAFPEYGNVELLNDAADKALYEAKRSGRNSVFIASK